MIHLIYGRVVGDISCRRYILPTIYLQWFPKYTNIYDCMVHRRVSLCCMWWVWYVGIEWIDNDVYTSA